MKEERASARCPERGKVDRERERERERGVGNIDVGRFIAMVRRRERDRGARERWDGEREWARG